MSVLMPKLQMYSQGSGVVLSEDGYIITNNHVVEGGAAYKVTVAGETYDAGIHRPPHAEGEHAGHKRAGEGNEEGLAAGALLGRMLGMDGLGFIGLLGTGLGRGVAMLGRPPGVPVGRCERQGRHHRRRCGRR